MSNDTDQSTASRHHTLGIRHTQASPGDHTHDGTTSEFLDATSGSAWVPFTPTVGSYGSNASIGNGAAVGRYKQIGKICLVHLQISGGTTSTWGTGGGYIAAPALPVNPEATATDGLHFAGSAFVPANGVASTQLLRQIAGTDGRFEIYGNTLPLIVPGSDQVRFDGNNYYTVAPADTGGDAGFPVVTVIDGFGNEVNLIVEKWTGTTIYLATAGRLARDFGGTTYATGTATRVRVVKPVATPGPSGSFSGIVYEWNFAYETA